MRVKEFFKRQSKKLIVSEALVIVGVIGYLDYITPYEVSLFVFYSFPVLLAVWCVGKKSGVFIALFSAFTWWFTDQLTAHTYPMSWLQMYNTVVRLAFFLFVAIGGAALKSQFELLRRSQELEREIIRISEREQRRIGQDLHDGLCQYYAAVGCAASTLKNRLNKLSLPEADDAGEIAELLNEGVTQTRNLARGLFPVRIDEAGLESALSELAAGAAMLLRIKCEFECAEHVPIADNEAATHLYRIAQEALNNATRHGHASAVVFSLSASNDAITLSIADNGAGFHANQNGTEGMGLKIMHYRARAIGGILKIAPNPDGGTVVSCSFKQAAESFSGKEK